MAQYVEVLIASTLSIIQHDDPHPLPLTRTPHSSLPTPYPQPLTPHAHPRNRITAWYLINVYKSPFWRASGMN